MSDERIRPAEVQAPLDDQRVYAAVVRRASRAGLVVLGLTFLLYVSGRVSPRVPLDELPRIWNLPLRQFIQATGSPVGRSWLADAWRGDVLSLGAIAAMAAIPIAALLALLPVFGRRRETALFVITLLQAAVLVAAAINLFGLGR